MEILEKAHNVYKALMGEANDASEAFAILNIVNTITNFEVQQEQQRLMEQQAQRQMQIPPMGRR